MDTISDIARIESMRGKITFREIWEFWERNHTAKHVLKLWDACDEYPEFCFIWKLILA